jgi:hypothetical protein
MYTKIFLTLALTLVTSTVSSGSINQKQNIEIQNPNGNGQVSATDEQSRQTIPWAPLWTDKFNDHERRHSHADDDGKSHQIHFDRYHQRRRKILFCFAGKIILLATYLCSLISLYLALRYQ